MNPVALFNQYLLAIGIGALVLLILVCLFPVLGAVIVALSCIGTIIKVVINLWCQYIIIKRF